MREHSTAGAADVTGAAVLPACPLFSGLISFRSELKTVRCFLILFKGTDRRKQTGNTSR